MLDALGFYKFSHQAHPKRKERMHLPRKTLDLQEKPPLLSPVTKKSKSIGRKG